MSEYPGITVETAREPMVRVTGRQRLAWFARRSALAAVLIGLASVGAGAEDLMRIAAVVNDKVISVYDLDSRVAMALASSKLPDTAEVRQQVTGPVLRNLIDEALKVQEADRQGVRVLDSEFAAAMDEVARNNGVAREALPDFLSKVGVSIGALESQVRAQIAWGKFVSQRLRPTIDVSDEDIQAEIDRLEANRGQPEYLVSEIDLYLDPQTSEQDLIATANGLVGQIRNGTDFAAIARQFSQGAMAPSGGNVGWIREGQSRPEIDQALRTMEVGSVSDPIRSLDGLHIISLRDKRAVMAEETADSDAEVYLSQILLPAAADEPAGAADDRLARANQVRAGLAGCKAMAARASELESSLSGDIGWLKMQDLPEEFRATVAGLEVDQPSAPIVTSAGVHVLMVCDRREPGGARDIRDVIYDRLAAQRLAILERRLLRDLRRNAFVDLRN